MKKPCLILVSLVIATGFVASGCGGLKVTIGPDSKEPLKEYTLEGKERGKVLIIPVRGFLSDAPGKSLLGERPGTVQEVVAQLRKAEKDDEIKAVLLEVNSPGGSITASDILYHEIMAFKERTKAKIVAGLMDVATSGGYYISLPADRIVAHPTTITGSVGVIFVNPKVMGLMDKLGVAVEVNKSGKEKDIGSPFRPSTPEEQKIFQELIDRMAKRFLDLVAKHRMMDQTLLSSVSTARIYSAEEALRLKLVDRVGYMSDAIAEAKDMSGLSKDARVVVYRRTKYANDTYYNTSTTLFNGQSPSLIDLNLAEIVPALGPGFYYLWAPGLAGN
ncbi:MAG TPA: signal peptide peptidase SppA [Syntrophorhabdales bacterium]|nr:signal peptide peptidase SppA [Syntrophorhabdales bacterium]